MDKLELYYVYVVHEPDNQTISDVKKHLNVVS